MIMLCLLLLFCLVPKEFHGSLKFSPGKNTNTFSSKGRARILKCSAEAAAKAFDDKVVLFFNSNSWVIDYCGLMTFL